MSWKKELRDFFIAMLVVFPIGFSISHFISLNVLFHISLTVIIGFPIYILFMHYVRRSDKLNEKPWD